MSSSFLTNSVNYSTITVGPDAEFILEMDASSPGLGAIILAQKQDGIVHPVAYASHTLNPHEKHYGITEMETLAVELDISIHRSLSMFVIIELPSSLCKVDKIGNVYPRTGLGYKHKPGKHNTEESV